MNENDEIRLSAWFDGELPEREKQDIEALLERDPDARAYMEDLRKTRELLAASHSAPGESVPEWSGVEERLKGNPGARILTFPRLAAGIAAVLVLAFSLWLPLRESGNPAQAPAAPGLMVNSVELVETDLEDATPIVYLDEPSGWTVVWVLENGIHEDADEI